MFVCVGRHVRRLLVQVCTYVFLFGLGVHACLLGVGSRFFVRHAYDVCVDKVEWFVHAQWDVVVT